MKKLIKNFIPYALFSFLAVANLRFLKWLLLRGANRYAYMQKVFYNRRAGYSRYSEEEFRDQVVGSYKKHNAWLDYDMYLMKYVDGSFEKKIALDFGCGPGRNIIKYHSKFKRIDGVDISEKNIENAKTNLKNFKVSNSKLYVNNGINLKDIPRDTYGFVMSTICMQHICVYNIRYNLLKEFFRILNKGGRISIQMGYGENSPDSVAYFTNEFNATTTNRGLDTRVESPQEIHGDLGKIGFSNFEYWIRPTGPGDTHPNWIFFTAVK